jgi:hypothetical protein
MYARTCGHRGGGRGRENALRNRTDDWGATLYSYVPRGAVPGLPLRAGREWSLAPGAGAG